MQRLSDLIQIFKNRSFVLLLIGQTISRFGDYVYEIGLMWLIYELTGSTVAMSGVLIAYFLPYVFFGFISGVFVDRVNRKKILIDNLFVGRIPFSKNDYHGVGPDILFTLMSCTNYTSYGYVKESLVVFRAHEKSITIDASLDANKRYKIGIAYDDARIYFFLNRIIAKLKIYRIIRKFINNRK